MPGDVRVLPRALCHFDGLRAEDNIEHSAGISIAIPVMTWIPQAHWKAQKLTVLAWSHLHRLLYPLFKFIIPLQYETELLPVMQDGNARDFD